jgi:hypothetical protein
MIPEEIAVVTEKLNAEFAVPLWEEFWDYFDTVNLEPLEWSENKNAKFIYYRVLFSMTELEFSQAYSEAENTYNLFHKRILKEIRPVLPEIGTRGSDLSGKFMQHDSGMFKFIPLAKMGEGYKFLVKFALVK